MKFIKNISRYRVLLNNGILLDIARARYKYVEEKLSLIEVKYKCLFNSESFDYDVGNIMLQNFF